MFEIRKKLLHIIQRKNIFQIQFKCDDGEKTTRVQKNNFSAVLMLATLFQLPYNKFQWVKGNQILVENHKRQWNRSRGAFKGYEKLCYR